MTPEKVTTSGMLFMMYRYNLIFLRFRV